MGLNLQHGGRIVVWFGLNWNLEFYQQGNARLHRQGQTKPVTIMHIVVAGGIDEKIMNALAGKATTQSQLLEHLRV
jgi:SNF2 family DNA or RNA helicase